jgi:hypothetical protein
MCSTQQQRQCTIQGSGVKARSSYFMRPISYTTELSFMTIPFHLAHILRRRLQHSASFLHYRHIDTPCPALTRNIPTHHHQLRTGKMSSSTSAAEQQPEVVVDVSSASKFPAFIKHDPPMQLGEALQYRPSDNTLHCSLRHIDLPARVHKLIYTISFPIM